jgi:flagellin-like hook-associated protein FlgL
VSGWQIYVKDLLTGQVRLASSNSSGNAGNGFSYTPQITPDGRFVVFRSNATNLIPGVSGTQIYVKDLLTGEVRLASSNSSGNAGNNSSYSPQITPDGRFVVFWSDATNLVAGASGRKLYVKDLSSGQVRLVQGVPNWVRSVWTPEISSDGRSIAVSFGNIGDTKSYILFNPFLVETELEVSQIVGLGAETAGQARNGLETITYFDKLLNELTSIAGSIEARLQVAASNIQTLIDNLEASSSRLSDADIAEEVSDLVAANTRQELSSYLLGVWKTIETTMAETFTNSILSTLPKDTLKDQPQKNTFTKSFYPEFYYTAKETTPAKQAKNTLYLGGVVPKGYFQI